MSQIQIFNIENRLDDVEQRLSIRKPISSLKSRKAIDQIDRAIRYHAACQTALSKLREREDSLVWVPYP